MRDELNGMPLGPKLLQIEAPWASVSVKLSVEPETAVAIVAVCEVVPVELQFEAESSPDPVQELGVHVVERVAPFATITFVPLMV